MMMKLEDMYSGPPELGLADGGGMGNAMGGFYIWNNCGIGLECFAFGLLLGIGGLYETIFNAVLLGTVFGFMARSPHAANLFHFVTAHGPFELTAVVLCAAAGMRLGFSVVAAHGLTRSESLRRAGEGVDVHGVDGVGPVRDGRRHRGLRLAVVAAVSGQGGGGRPFLRSPGGLFLCARARTTLERSPCNLTAIES